MKRFRLKSALAVLAALATAGIALAFWLTSEGTGSGEATVTTLEPPVVTLGTPDAGALHVQWTAATVVGDSTDGEFTYFVERKVQNDPDFAPITEGPCAGELEVLECTDDLPETANYVYRVVAHYRSWTATSDTTEPITVEVGPAETDPPYVTAIERLTPPSQLTNVQSVQWKVTFVEPVKFVDAADFHISPDSGVSGASISGVSPASGPATTYTVTVDTGTGDGLLGLDLIDDNSIEDPAHNKLGDSTGGADGDFTTGENYTIDKTPPTVESINRALDENDAPRDELTNDSSVAWTVEFSEGVSGVNGPGGPGDDPSDFVLDPDPEIEGAAISSVVQESPTTYTVTASTGSGDGTIGLDLTDDDSIEDGAENPLAGASDGSFTTGQTYLLDRTGPMVQSISREQASPTNLGSVQWKVKFDDNSVQGVNEDADFEDDFTLVVGGAIAGAGITDVVAQAGGTYIVTATTGTGDGTLGLDVQDDGTITDQLGNPLGGPGAHDGDFVGDVYTIDRTAPTVASITRDGDSATSADHVSWTVEFSEDVTGVGSDDFDLAVAGLSGSPAITDVQPVTGSTKEYTVTASTGAGEGTLNLNVDDDDTIEDAAHNELGGADEGDGDFSGPAEAQYDVDRLAPQLESLEMRDVDGDGFVDQVVAKFHEDIESSTSNGFWTLTNTPGGATKGALTTAGDEAILAINEDGAGKHTDVGTFKVQLAADAAAGIRDAVGNASSFGPQAPADKAAPIVTAITRTGTSPTNSASVPFGVSFSEPVSGVTSDDFALGAGAPTGASVDPGAISGSGASYTVSVATGTGGTGTIELKLSDNDSIVDLASPANALAGTGTGNGDFTGPQTYSIDKVAPSVSSIVRGSPTAADTNASSVQFTVTFTKSVQTVVAGDFALGGTLSTGSISGVSGTGASRTVTVSTGSGTGTLRLDLSDSNNSIKDEAGNAVTPSTFTGGDAYNVDHGSPSVSSIVRGNPTAGTTNATSVEFTVTFSESVETVVAGDFALAGTLTTGSISDVTGSGASRTVTVATGGGSGTLRLDLSDSNSSIKDKAGNAVSPTAFTAGDLYTIDHGNPSVSSISRVTAEYTNTTGDVQWTVTFSEGVETVVSGDFTLGGTSAGGSITGVSGTGATRTVTASTGGEGTLRLDLSDSDNSIKDPAGNAVSPNTFTGDPYTVDRTAPTLSTVEMFDANTNGIVERVDATFSEALDTTSGSTAGWTATNRPTGIGLNTVTVAGSTASLNFTGGTAGVNTTSVSQGAAGNFTIAFDRAVAQLRDRAGNKPAANFSQSPTDKAAPVPFELVDTNGTTDGRFQAADTATLSFTENVTNSAATPMTVTLTHTATNDEWSAPGFIDGSRSLGSGNYLITNGATTATFSSSKLTQPDTYKVRVELGTCSGVCATTGNPRLDAPNAASPATVVPATSIKDTSSAQNQAVQNSASTTFSIKLF